jgi:hypothetical protein
MRRSDGPRFAIVVYRVEMDRARIDALVIGVCILVIVGRSL